MAEPLVGVLGGMGPAATAEFYRLLVEHTPATRDQDHLRLAFWADPTVPERTPALRGTGPSVVPALTHGVQQLLGLGADLIACPCNTVHVWLPGIAEELGAPLVSIIDATADACAAAASSGRVAVLATSATVESGLYQRALSERGVEVLVPGAQAQADVTEVIRLVKSGRSADLALAGRLLRQVAAEMAQQGASDLLSGCTEVSVVAGRTELAAPVVDSLESLAGAVVARARAARTGTVPSGP